MSSSSLSTAQLDRALLDATTSMAWAVDRRYRLLTSNLAFKAAMAATIGRLPMPGESMLMEAFAPHVLRHWRALYDAAFEGRPGEFVSEMPTPEGTMLLELVTAPLRDPQTSQVIGCAAVCRDLRAGTPVERELIARQSMDRSLFRKHPLPMWVFDDESLEFLAVNDAAVVRYGWSEREFLAMTILDIRPPEAIEVLIRQVAGEPGPRAPNSGTWEHMYRDGTVVTVEVHTAPVTYRGRPSRLVTVHDITAAKAVSRRALRQGELLRRTTDSMPIGMLLVSRSGRVRWSNAAVRELLGVLDAPNTLAEVFDRVHPGDQETARDREAVFQRGGGAPAEPTDLRFVQPDGRIVWGTLRGVPVDGDDDLTIITVADRTEYLAARDAEQDLRAKLLRQQHLESLGALAAGLSHEFRNLLAVIGGHTELLRMIDPADPAFGQSLDDLAHTTDQGRILVQSILALSRGAPDATRAWTPALDAMRAAARVVQASVPQTPIALELPTGTPECTVSPTEWTQLLLNLVQNGVRAVAGRPKPLVRVSARLLQLDGPEELRTGPLAAGTYLCVTVRDNGSGIAPEALPRIFDPFFTTTEAHGGTGLGLSVVASIVRRAGGAIDVQSHVEIGTTIALYLPARGDAAPATTGPLRVLLVVTDFARKRTIEARLREAGFAVEVSTGPTAALARLRAHADDIMAVYVDFDLGRHTGADIAANIRSIAPDTPVVLGAASGLPLDATGLGARGVTLIVDAAVALADPAPSIRRAMARARDDR
ncbi:MAG: ATP-binding protein [Gemmatimonadaceae bacterium]|nr:ATP-binding protein [Gemmatimonadaceae bacterium]